MLLVDSFNIVSMQVTETIFIMKIHISHHSAYRSPKITPYNVGSVLRRLFSTVGDSISTCGGIASVLRRLFSTVGDSISTVGG